MSNRHDKRGNGKALELFGGTDAAEYLDAQVWWWHGMTKALANIPRTHKPLARLLALEMAAEWFKRGDLPKAPTALCKLLSWDRRTLVAHLDEARGIMTAHFLDMPRDRRAVVAIMERRRTSGRKGGSANLHANLYANLQMDTAENRHFSEAKLKLVKK